MASLLWAAASVNYLQPQFEKKDTLAVLRWLKLCERTPNPRLGRHQGMRRIWRWLERATGKLSCLDFTYAQDQSFESRGNVLSIAVDGTDVRVKMGFHGSRLFYSYKFKKPAVRLQFCLVYDFISLPSCSFCLRWAGADTLWLPTMAWNS